MEADNEETNIYWSLLCARHSACYLNPHNHQPSEERIMILIFKGKETETVQG